MPSYRNQKNCKRIQVRKNWKTPFPLLFKLRWVSDTSWEGVQEKWGAHCLWQLTFNRPPLSLKSLQNGYQFDYLPVTGGDEQIPGLPCGFRTALAQLLKASQLQQVLPFSNSTGG